MTAFSGNWFQRRIARQKAASTAYEGVLKAALVPEYYARAGVPDTFEGRSRMVTVMTSLACVRISQLGGAEARKLMESLNTLVLDGFDAAFREKGVGDASIARKVRTLAEGHSGLGKALFAALGAPDRAGREAVMADTLIRNAVTLPEQAPVLAATLLGLQARLERQADSEILHGRFDWSGAAAAGDVAGG